MIFWVSHGAIMSKIGMCLEAKNSPLAVSPLFNSNFPRPHFSRDTDE